MAKLPELDIARVRRWCGQRVPEHARDQVRTECDAGPRHLTIVECRPPWREGTGPEWNGSPSPGSATCRQPGHGRCTGATGISASTSTTSSRHHRIDDLLHEIGRDPTAILWGEERPG
jgi:hypothetical protein